jgi:acetyltransferase
MGTTGKTRAAGECSLPASVLQAKSVAVVGASERAKWPTIIINNLKKQGYPGRIDFINPRQTEVFGQKCYPSIADLPEAPDHAMIIVPAAAVPNVLTDAEKRGVKTATVYAAGLGDGDDPASVERGAWLRNFLATSKLRISGPNCMGAMSYREKLFGYPNTALASIEPGPNSLIFQSGGTLQFFMGCGADRGLRYAYGISSGNEVDIDLADYLDFLVRDDATKTIMLFVEGIRRPEAFMSAAGRALEAGKPVLAIKTGRSAKSRAAAQSHTGAIAGDFAAWMALCDRYGIVNCRSLDDMLEVALAFECGRRPKGPRVGWVTTSGGTVDLLYDYVEAEGSTLAELAPQTIEALNPLMQDGITPKNPLDAGIPAGHATTAKWCNIIAADPGVDILALAAQTPRKDYGDVAPLVDMMNRTDKPIIGFGRMIYQVTPDVIEMQKTLGFPFLQGLEPTVRAINALWFHAERQGKLPAAPGPAKPSTLTAATLDAELQRYGIASPKSRLAPTPDAAADAASSIGYPVALKIVSPDILHKTEAGGVLLDLKDAAAVTAGTKTLIENARRAMPNARIEGVLVQEMASGVEAIIGARNDPLYGPVLLVGSGGVMVELAQDVALKLLPVTREEVAKMVDLLRLDKLLGGYRGTPVADRDALIECALALGRFFLDHQNVIDDIEINPLMVRPKGGGAVAVDVCVIWRTGN